MKELRINLVYLARTYGLENGLAKIELDDKGDQVLVLSGDVKTK